MKKMDEMDRNIKLRSVEWGYKAAILLLAIWTFYEIYLTLFVNHGDDYNILPAIVIWLSSCTQWVSETILKRKMVAGDEEYKEPNKLLRFILSGIVIAAIVVAVGVYILMIN